MLSRLEPLEWSIVRRRLEKSVFSPWPVVEQTARLDGPQEPPQKSRRPRPVMEDDDVVGSVVPPNVEVVESGDLNPGVTREVGSQHDSVLELLREAIDSAVDESDRWSVVLDRRPLDVC